MTRLYWMLFLIALLCSGNTCGEAEQGGCGGTVVDPVTVEDGGVQSMPILLRMDPRRFYDSWDGRCTVSELGFQQPSDWEREFTDCAIDDCDCLERQSWINHLYRQQESMCLDDLQPGGDAEALRAFVKDAVHCWKVLSGCYSHTVWCHDPKTCLDEVEPGLLAKCY